MSAAQRKVLIVDDSKLARMSIAKAFKALHPGWSLVEAANADDAVATAKQTPVDIAVLDYNMPGRNGLLLGAELLSFQPKLPILILSANAQMEIVEGARRIGARFLAKPLAAGALQEFLDHALPRPDRA